MELKHNTKLLNEKQSSKRTSDASYLRDKQNHETLERKLEQAKEKLTKIDYREGALEELEEQKLALTDECRQIKRQLDQKNAQRYEFQYQDPEPGFDRTKVKGMLCNLFTVRDPVYHVALSTCGGGTLYNMVVDNELTSKKVLQNGRLQTRTTIIPMNKIVGSRLPDKTVQFAQRLVGKENVIPALDCIQYDQSLETVMRYVFGRTFICKDMATARKVCFHDQIRTRCITFDGDAVDPEGTLSGGSRAEGPALLDSVAEIKKLRAMIAPKDQELRTILTAIVQITQTSRTFNKCKEEVDMVQIELESVKQRLAQTSFQKHQQEIEDAKAEIGKFEIILR